MLYKRLFTQQLKARQRIFASFAHFEYGFAFRHWHFQLRVSACFIQSFLKNCFLFIEQCKLSKHDVFERIGTIFGEQN